MGGQFPRNLNSSALFGEALPEYLQLPRHNPLHTLRYNEPVIKISLV